MKRLVVLISGEGGNLQAILDACQQQRITATLLPLSAINLPPMDLNGRGQQPYPPSHCLPQTLPTAKRLTAS